jgi:hypothetical protein
LVKEWRLMSMIGMGSILAQCRVPSARNTMGNSAAVQAMSPGSFATWHGAIG